MSEQKLLVPNIAVKLVKNTCKSAKPVPDIDL